jgi:hypothetical protein
MKLRELRQLIREEIENMSGSGSEDIVTFCNNHIMEINKALASSNISKISKFKKLSGSLGQYIKNAATDSKFQVIIKFADVAKKDKEKYGDEDYFMDGSPEPEPMTIGGKKLLWMYAED